MQAIEFNYESRGGVIKIPECDKDWFKSNHSEQFLLSAWL